MSAIINFRRFSSIPLALSGPYHLTFWPVHCSCEKSPKFQTIRRIKFSTVSKNSFLHTHLQICVVGCGYRIVLAVLCLCLIVETKYLNTYSAVFWCLAVRSAPERQSGIWSLGVSLNKLLICLLPMREEAGSWRNPVYLSPVRAAIAGEEGSWLQWSTILCSVLSLEVVCATTIRGDDCCLVCSI
ncbi:hypothetical protein L207DRAFT_248068 [Hyaloscypha variabilis F]|jgi:hypothetical protein|uniref:Uncharacterized protein n=1 Tax=Hyaloscypha variabilis (strain UAMH 11265 / GT02V1 / F) TaxID=1149755 RepID=A0A2J6S2Y5_HYAVF|nr:hypothetical protein L207DRAFT_248068 [Hyaloscypha variabilis F]